MMKRLSPEWVIFYGRVPEECDWNVIRVKPHYDDIVKRRKAKWAAVAERELLAQEIPGVDAV